MLRLKVSPTAPAARLPASLFPARSPRPVAGVLYPLHGNEVWQPVSAVAVSGQTLRSLLAFGDGPHRSQNNSQCGMSQSLLQSEVSLSRVCRGNSGRVTR